MRNCRVKLLSIDPLDRLPGNNFPLLLPHPKRIIKSKNTFPALTSEKLPSQTTVDRSTWQTPRKQFPLFFFHIQKGLSRVKTLSLRLQVRNCRVKPLSIDPLDRTPGNNFPLLLPHPKRIIKSKDTSPALTSTKLSSQTTTDLLPKTTENKNRVFFCFHQSLVS